MLVLLLMVTSTGERRCFCAMRRIGAGMVAENKRHLTLRRRLLENALDGVDEAHAQHFVGFVEHQKRQTRELQGAAVHVIDHAAGRPDHHVHAAPQGVELRLIALAAVDRQHVKALQMRGVLLERLGHLQGELARRAPAPAPAAPGCDRSMRASAARRRRRSCRCRSAPGRAYRRPESSTGMVAAWMGEGDS